MKHKTFLEWCRDNEDLVNEIREQAKLMECETCEGTGRHECECGHTHTCLQCKGTGKINGVTDPVKQKYNEIVEREKYLASIWAKEPIRKSGNYA